MGAAPGVFAVLTLLKPLVTALGLATGARGGLMTSLLATGAGRAARWWRRAMAGVHPPTAGLALGGRGDAGHGHLGPGVRCGVHVELAPPGAAAAGTHGGGVLGGAPPAAVDAGAMIAGLASAGRRGGGDGGAGVGLRTVTSRAGARRSSRRPLSVTTMVEPSLPHHPQRQRHGTEHRQDGQHQDDAAGEHQVLAHDAP
ncbi:MAG: hypothetical protein U0Y82_16115 [Thermoleophilia bacterium]